MKTDQSHTFLSRFDLIRLRMRRTQIEIAGCVAMLCAVAGLVLLAGVDFHYELSLPMRARSAGLAAISICGWLLIRIVKTIKEWSPTRTAVELEQHFPTIGQRARTTVQFRDRETDGSNGGVSLSLVKALETETTEAVEPLEIDRVVPVGRLALCVGILIVGCLVLVNSAVKNPEWRMAIQRVFLSDSPYSVIDVTPGNTLVDEGQSVEITFDVTGRQRDFILQTQPAAEPHAEWADTEFRDGEIEQLDKSHQRYITVLSHVSGPLRYRVVAGDVQSSESRIDVRFPLEIKSLSVQVTPPAYTEKPIEMIDGGNVNSLEGGHARVRVTLDRPAKEAKIVQRFRNKSAAGDAGDEGVALPVVIKGNTLTADMVLTEDFQWSLNATAEDDAGLPENIFRVRVREDRPPQIRFQEPDQKQEVHPLVEIPMRVRVTDDFGLTRAGIVFQINNDEEHTLLLDEFVKPSKAGTENSQGGKVKVLKHAVLQKMLPLEYFSLTQKDSVAYYAFAEDNSPDQQRSESDLRFLDIRPFRITYRIRESGDGGQARGGFGDFMPLEELIQDQRTVLNRTRRIDQRQGKWDDTTLNAVDLLVQKQTLLADMTRAILDILSDKGADDVDVLAQAEIAMRKAADSMSAGKFDAAVLQQKDAQQYLVESREKLEQFLNQTGGGDMRRAAGDAVRRRISEQLRPQTELARVAQLIAERLFDVANVEDDISRKLYAAAAESENPDSGPESNDSNRMTAERLEERQYEAAADVEDIRQIIENRKEFTPFVRKRIESAARVCGDASREISQGGVVEAALQTAEASQMFAELGTQLQALAQREVSARIAAVREGAHEIAGRQRTLANRFSRKDEEVVSMDTVPAIVSNDDPRVKSRFAGTSKLAEANRLAERAITLQEILKSFVAFKGRNTDEAIELVADVVKTQDVARTVQRTVELPGSIAKRTAVELATEADSIADRLELLAVSLDQLYRSISTPRLERLRDLEEQAVTLLDDMDRVPDRQTLQAWYRSAFDLIGSVREARLASVIIDFEEIVDGENSLGPEDWLRSPKPEDRLEPPNEISQRLSTVVDTLQRHLQEMILTDVPVNRNEPTPPEYERLVQRYLKVISEK